MHLSRGSALLALSAWLVTPERRGKTRPPGVEPRPGRVRSAAWPVDSDALGDRAARPAVRAESIASSSPRNLGGSVAPVSSARSRSSELRASIRRSPPAADCSAVRLRAEYGSWATPRSANDPGGCAITPSATLDHRSQIVVPADLVRRSPRCVLHSRIALARIRECPCGGAVPNPLMTAAGCRSRIVLPRSFTSLALLRSCRVNARACQ